MTLGSSFHDFLPERVKTADGQWEVETVLESLIQYCYERNYLPRYTRAIILSSVDIHACMVIFICRASAQREERS